MAGRYERVNAHDDDGDDDHVRSPDGPAPSHSIPNSPPPSFHSRASSIISRDPSNRSHQNVDPDLADAFDAADDDSDDEADDRQRLVRGNSLPLSAARAGDATRSSPLELGSTTRQDAHQVSGQPQQSMQSAANAGPPTTAAATSIAPGRVYGSGIQSDGVFSNLSAKPERDSGEKEELPPSYEQAAADAAPPYWETTILAPGYGGPDDVFIDGMPVGSFFSFFWNGMISTSFQLVGFLLTYLLHSSHASKHGSRAGLGITFIQYGFYMKDSSEAHGGTGGGSGGGSGAGPGDSNYANPPDPNSHNFDPNTVQGAGPGGESGGFADIASGDWVAFVLMTAGWFILLKAVSDYIKARRHEQLVLQSPDRGLGIPIIATGEAADTVV